MSSTDNYPFFSIIIPTYNRPTQLGACLQAISRLDYPRDRFEVIIVDDESEESPESMVALFQDRLNVKLIRQSRAGVGIGRNTGAAQARGEFLVFTDDDCEPAPTWLQALAIRFRETPHCIVGGRTINALSENIYSTASQLLISYLYAYYNTNPNQARFLAGSNLAVPVDRFQALDGFDEIFFLMGAEEREFCDRWMDHGYQMIYAPKVIVYHSHTLTFRTFVRQHFNYGRGAFYFHQVRAKRGHQQIKVEPGAFYLNLLRYPFTQKYRSKALLLSILLVISQVANITGFFWENIK